TITKCPDVCWFRLIGRCINYTPDLLRASPRWWAVQDLNLPPRRSPRPPSAYSSRATAQHTWGSVQVQAFQLEWQRSRMLHEHFERNLTSRLPPRRGQPLRILPLPPGGTDVPPHPPLGRRFILQLHTSVAMPRNYKCQGHRHAVRRCRILN